MSIYRKLLGNKEFVPEADWQRVPQEFYCLAPASGSTEAMRLVANYASG